MGAVRFTIDSSGLAAVSSLLAGACKEAEHAVAVQIAKDTSPFVPFRTGSLDQRTQVEESEVIYPGPYARYLYNGKVMVDPVTHAAGFLTKDGWKSRKGVTKVLTDRDLHIWTSGHPQAQAHWFEASKAQNSGKWLKAAAKAVTNDYGNS